jgi:hypothetical protein
MSQRRRIKSEDEMLPEYDFTGAVRGKYYERYRQGTNVVLLDPDVATAFRDSAAVNDALRLLISLAQAKVPPGNGQAGEQHRANKGLHQTRQKAERP